MGWCVRMASGPGTLAALLAATPAPAQEGPGPRILDTSDAFASGAQEVPLDTPSAFVWSTYQSGQRDGWFYRIFPDGRGVLSRDPRFRRDWTAITCVGPAGCRAEGPQVPPAALPMLDALGTWIARSGTPPVPAPPPPQRGPGVAAAPDGPERAQPPVAAPALRQPGHAPGDILPPRLPPPRKELVADAAPRTLMPAQGPPSPRTARAAVPAFAPHRTLAPATQAKAPAADIARPPFRSTEPVLPPAPPPRAPRPTRFDCTLSGTLGLSYTSDGGAQRLGKLSGTFGCGYRHPSGLSIRLALTGVPLAGQRTDADSSLSYAISYPFANGYSLQYASYSAQFPRQPQGVIGAFGQGGFRLSKALPPLDLPHLTGWNGIGPLTCQAYGAWDPGAAPSAGITCGITAFGKLTLRGTAIAYTPGAQKDWQPDFTYSASYPLTDRVAIEYSNYSANRFPWNGGGSGRGVMSGSIRMTYRFSF